MNAQTPSARALEQRIDRELIREARGFRLVRVRDYGFFLMAPDGKFAVRVDLNELAKDLGVI